MSASYRLKDIVHETDRHFILRVPKGFEVYRKDVTHSFRCGVVGFTGDEGVSRAIAEVERREQSS